MKNQLIPPPELAPPSIKHLPMEQRVALWGKWVDESLEWVKAGLRQRSKSEDDFANRYRQWYQRRMDEHDRAMRHMLDELHRREANRAG